jgi:hypothetical protein
LHASAQKGQSTWRFGRHRRRRAKRAHVEIVLAESKAEAKPKREKKEEKPKPEVKKEEKKPEVKKETVKPEVKQEIKKEIKPETQKPTNEVKKE